MSINKEKFSTDDIPELAELLDYLKAAKVKTVKPEFQIEQRVEWKGYGEEYSGEILEINIEIKDDGEPLITYTVEGVGTYWESELVLS